MKKFILILAAITLLVLPGVIFAQDSETKVCPAGCSCSENTATCPTKPAVTGSGYILTPTNGKCPDGYLISVDVKQCVKPTFITKPIVAPAISEKPSTGETGTTILTPTNGQCPKEYIISSDNKQCLKRAMPDLIAVPTIVIAPNEGIKEIIMEAQKTEAQIKDTSTGQQATVSTAQGFKTIVAVPTAVNKSRDVVIESLPGEKKIVAIRVGANTEDCQIYLSDCNNSNQQACEKWKANCKEVIAETKESVKIKENKIFVKEKEIKIMPDTASAIATEKLQSLGWQIELKDVGQHGKAKPVYQILGAKDVKIFWLFSAKMPVSAEVDAQTGSLDKIKKPWWSFLAK